MYTSKRGEHVARCCVSSSVHDLRHCIIIYVEFIAPHNVERTFVLSSGLESDKEKRDTESERKK